jgi:hypothetical protein
MRCRREKNRSAHARSLCDIAWYGAFFGISFADPTSKSILKPIQRHMPEFLVSIGRDSKKWKKSRPVVKMDARHLLEFLMHLDLWILSECRRNRSHFCVIGIHPNRYCPYGGRSGYVTDRGVGLRLNSYFGPFPNDPYRTWSVNVSGVNHS